MKKIILAATLAFSAFSANADIQIKDWAVDSDCEAMVSATYKDGEYGAYWHTFNTANTYLKVQGLKGFEEQVVILTVNGTNVKFRTKSYDWGTTFSPATKNGLKHVNDVLWGATKISVILPDGSGVWWSAKGFQQAWRYMNSCKAI